MADKEKKSGLFEALYALKEEAVAESKKPFVAKKIARAFDSAMDSLEAAKIDQQEKINKLEAEIANGKVEQIKALIQAVAELDEFDTQIKICEKVKKEFFPE